MSRVSDWLLDMEETAADLLNSITDHAWAREVFLHKFPGQEHVFEACLTQWNEENSQFGVGA